MSIDKSWQPPALPPPAAPKPSSASAGKGAGPAPGAIIPDAGDRWLDPHPPQSWQASGPSRRWFGWFRRGHGGGPRPRRHWFWRALFWLIRNLALLGAGVAVASVAWVYVQLPPYDTLLDGRERGGVVLLDHRGEAFAWRGAQHGIITARDASPHLVNAIIAIEDRRFRSHLGIDLKGLARAMWVNYRAGHMVQGGSTLTQQTAKLVFLSNERSLTRKLAELPYAVAMELKYSKDEILTIYLNRAYLGAGAHGFEAAAQRYFGKSARVVNPAEAAMLAGLLKAPSRYAPTNDLGRAQGRAAVVLDWMEREGKLTAAQLAEARAKPAVLMGAARQNGAWYADFVFDSLPDWLTETKTDLIVETSFDPHAQRLAESSMAKVFEARVKEGSNAQAAIVVLGVDGAIRAMVGGRDHSASPFNRATQARRQAGSAFKPIVYVAALENGLHPIDVAVDEPLTIGKWSPENYDHKYVGPVTLADALAKSINTVAVRLSESVGRARVREMGARLGLPGELADGPALALGVSEVTLLDLTGVYAHFANNGLEARPWAIRRVRTKDGQVLMDRGEPIPERVLSQRDAGWITHMLTGVTQYGTGQRAALPDRPVAGKTGTTQAARDAWFIGFSADYVTGVWMGKDDNTPLIGVAGGGLPAMIFRETMLGLHKGLPVRELPLTPYDYVASPDGVLVEAGREILREVTTQGESVLESVLRDVISIFGGSQPSPPSPPQPGWRTEPVSAQPPTRKGWEPAQTGESRATSTGGFSRSDP